jgi:hypothetical protein
MLIELNKIIIKSLSVWPGNEIEDQVDTFEVMTQLNKKLSIQPMQKVQMVLHEWNDCPNDKFENNKLKVDNVLGHIKFYLRIGTI